MYKSFRIVLLQKDFDRVMEAEFWPDGVGCSWGREDSVGGTLKPQDGAIKIEQMQDTLRIGTFNCEGLHRNKRYLHNLLQSLKLDIMCVQETWLLDCNMDTIGNVHNEYHFVGQSGVSSTDHVLQGPPFGGVAILWHESVSKYIVPIKCHVSSRITGITMDIKGTKCLIICVYMPCDTNLVNSLVLMSLSTLWIILNN